MGELSQSEASPKGANEIDLLQVAGVLYSKKWILLVTTLLALAAAIAYLKVTPPVYRATALLEVPQSSRSSTGLNYFLGEDYGGDEVLKTVERKLQRISLLRRVVESTPALHAAPATADGPMTSLALAEALQGNLDIRLETGTRLIAVSAEATDPGFAQTLSNRIVEEFIRETSAEIIGTSKSALEFLTEEAERIGERLQESQSQLQGFELVVATHDKIEEQKDVIETLTQRYGENHPSVQQARSLLASLTSKFDTSLERVRPFLGGSPAPAPGEEDPDAEFELAQSRLKILSGEVQTSQTRYEVILGQMMELDLTRHLEDGALIFSEPAPLPSRPVHPSRLLVLAASVVLGGGCGLFIILALHLMNRTLRTVDEAESIVGLEVIGALPQEGGGTEIAEPGSAIAEAFRTLRAELLLLEDQEGGHCYLVTSAVPGEGKSFVASNLAVAFAEQGERRTLLVDAGLRRPMVDRIFDLVDVGEGLGGVLGETNGSWTSAVRESGVPNLDLLPAGSAIHKPAELLSGQRLGLLVRELAANYDCVIIDSPAVNTVADGLLVAGHTGKSILVAAAGRTHRNAVTHACELLTNVGSKPIGLVLNRLPRRAGFAGNPYYYHFGSAGKAYRAPYRRS